jgi:putative SOS response-associated peptidase YedK
LVPANSFAEYALEPNAETKKKDVVWFALNEDRPLFAFAGIWSSSRVIAARNPTRSRVRIW